MGGISSDLLPAAGRWRWAALRAECIGEGGTRWKFSPKERGRAACEDVPCAATVLPRPSLRLSVALVNVLPARWGLHYRNRPLCTDAFISGCVAAVNKEPRT